MSSFRMATGQPVRDISFRGSSGDRNNLGIPEHMLSSMGPGTAHARPRDSHPLSEPPTIPEDEMLHGFTIIDRNAGDPPGTFAETHFGRNPPHNTFAGKGLDDDDTSSEETGTMSRSVFSDSGVSEATSTFPSWSASSTSERMSRQYPPMHRSLNVGLMRSPSDVGAQTHPPPSNLVRHNQLMRSSSDMSSSRASSYIGQADMEESHGDDQEVFVFCEPPNRTLHCLLCEHVYQDPVIVSCGHTFCKRCVMEPNDGACPVHRVKLSIGVANIAVAEQVGELRIHCKYGCKLAQDGVTHIIDLLGCPVKVRISSRREHEKDCQFAPVKCPNNPDCPQLLRKDLEAHLQICEHVTCPHTKYGCVFHGTAEELAVHLDGNCPYEEVKEFLWRTDNRITDLQVANNQKDQDIGFLRSMLGKLSEKVDNLEKNTEIKFECVEGNQNKLMDEFIDIRREYTQLQEDFVRLHDNMNQAGQGAYDPTQIFKCKGTFVGHQGPVWCLCAHNEYLFSGSSDKTVKVWDIGSTFKCIRTLEGHQSIVLALCVYGNKLYSGSQDCRVVVWNLDGFNQLRKIDAHDNHVCTLAAARNVIFSGSLKNIKVWDAHTHELKKEITGLNHWVRALVATQNYLFSGSYQTIKIWDLDSLECVRDLETSGGSVYSIAISTHYILCGTFENCIHMWELDTYKQVDTLMGHSGTVYALAALNTPNGAKVLSASYDRTLRVWSMDNLICTQTLARHQGSVACLAVSRGQVFSGAVDSTVKVWQ